MKSFVAFISVFSIIAIYTANAQSVFYSVEASGDCSSRSVEFVVPEGKVAKLMVLDIIPSWTSCNSNQAVPTLIWAKVYKSTQATGERQPALYRKSIDQSGRVEENTPIQEVILTAGIYILEISRAATSEAKLELFLSDK